MNLLAIEHSRIGYFIDSAFYLAAIVLLSGVLLYSAPPRAWVEVGISVASGFAIWGLIEYAMHRFVLHHIIPFRKLHEEHHRRPQVLLATPTLMSAAMIVVFVFLPGTLLGNILIGSGITLGVATGYFEFGVVHYAVHYGRLHGPWIMKRKRIHALHHRFPDRHFGVTMSFWDRVFHTTKSAAR
ncbi:MAG: sterol desaturase family protein [Acidiferrobacterales bacterium]